MTDAYDVLGLRDAARGDDVFRQLVLARIIEPTSKLDSLRVLEEAGINPPAYRTLKRRLPVSIRKVVAGSGATFMTRDQLVESESAYARHLTEVRQRSTALIIMLSASSRSSTRSSWRPTTEGVIWRCCG